MGMVLLLLLPWFCTHRGSKHYEVSDVTCAHMHESFFWLCKVSDVGMEVVRAHIKREREK